MIFSAALMVKNEEVHLERCIKSILKVVDEIIILDTGSTDKTVEIAKKYTTKVFHQPWQQNFALHRNESFSHCTGDWILQIDADEELIFNEGMHSTTLPRFLEKLPDTINAVGVPLKDWRTAKNAYVAEFDVVRIFRKDTVTYKRRIHNEPMYDGETGYFPLGFLKHYGYNLTPEQETAKAKRTIGMLEETMAEDPKDYESLFYLSQAHASWGKQPEIAIDYAEKYLAKKDELGFRFNPSIYHLPTSIYIKKGEFDLALEWAQKGLEFDSEDVDLWWDLLHIGIGKQKKELIATGAQRFAHCYQNMPNIRLKHAGRFFFNNNEEAYATALYYLVVAYMENGAIEYIKLQNALAQCENETSEKITVKTKEILNQLGWHKAAVINSLQPIGSTADNTKGVFAL